MITRIRSVADGVRGRLVTMAHDDRGSASAETVIIAAVFISIAIIIGKLFGSAIIEEAGKVAKQITSQ